MPTRVYMGVDARHDHSLRVPRPDLAVSHGTPDACTACHTERKPDWAAGKVRVWLGRNARGAQQHLPGGSAAEQQALVDSPAQAALARASALASLAATPSQAAVTSALRDLTDPSPQVRESALSLIAVTHVAEHLIARIRQENDYEVGVDLFEKALSFMGISDTELDELQQRVEAALADDD